MSKTDDKTKNTEKNTDQGVAPALDGNARRLANLMPPFKPGQSGNPNGRPLGKRNKDTMFELALEAYARKLLGTYNKRHKKKINFEDFDGDPELDIFMQLVDKARNGDLKAIEAFLEHRHGKAVQTNIIKTDEDSPEFIAEMESAKADASQFFKRFGVKVEVTVQEKKTKAKAVAK